MKRKRNRLAPLGDALTEPERRSLLKIVAGYAGQLQRKQKPRETITKIMNAVQLVGLSIDRKTVGDYLDEADLMVGSIKKDSILT